MSQTPPAYTPPAIPPAKKPWYRRTWVIASGTFLLGVALGGTGGSSSASDTKDSSAKNAPSSLVDTSEPAAPVVEDSPEPEPVVYPVRARDFTIKVKIRTKECFGSAGCIVTYQIDPSYEGMADLKSGSYDITYKVTGANDPIINTMTLEDGTFSFDQEEDTQTPSTSSVLKAKVTSVEEQ